MANGIPSRSAEQKGAAGLDYELLAVVAHCWERDLSARPPGHKDVSVGSVSQVYPRVMRIPLLVLLGGCLLSAGCGDGNGDRARASATPSAESESDEVLREAVVEALREAGQEQDDRAEQAVTFA